MRGYVFALAVASLASIGSASVAYDFSAYWNEDTAVYINPGSLPANNGIVVKGMYQAVIGEGVNGGTGILGEDAYGVKAYGKYQFPGVYAEGEGYYNSNAVYGKATSDYNAVGVIGEAYNGYSPIGVKGYVTTQASETWLIGVHGLAQNGNPYSYEGYQNNTVGVRAEAYGNGYYDWAYGVYASASGASGANYAGWFDGDINVTGTCYCTPSDEKLKTNVKPLDKGLSTVMALEPKTYDMRVDEYKGKLSLAKGHQVGMIAQEVEKLMPELVTKIDVPARETKDKDGKVTKIEAMDYKTLNYVGLIPVLVKAIQEQEAKIQALEKKLTAK